MSDLKHFSDKPLSLSDLYDTELSVSASEFTKPRGLWLSDESQFSTGWSWAAWCNSDAPDFIAGKIEHDVVLFEDANVLLIKGQRAIDRFTRHYGVQSTWRDTAYAIEWDRVAKDYDGILITPYIFSRRLTPHTSWYYGWDCASACIWRPTKAIEAIAPTTARQSAAA